MMRHALYKTLFLVVACGIAVFLASCEEDVAAVIEQDWAYSLYGVVTPQADTQKVRVFPIEGRLELREVDTTDARVTSENHITGEVVEWNHRTLTEPDGRLEYSFEAPFAAEYGTVYRLQAESPDGRRSYADVEIPPEVVIEEGEPTFSPFVTLPIHLHGEAPHFLKMEIVYEVKYAEGATDQTTVEIPLSHRDRPQKVDGGWQLILNMTNERGRLRDRLDALGLRDPAFGVMVLRMELRTMVVDAAWDPPEDNFDSEVLVQPGTMSNVENGFGFIGGGYRISHRLLPSLELLREAGFRVN